MGAQWPWLVLVFFFIVAISFAVRLIDDACGFRARPVARLAILAAAGCLLGLVVLGLLYKVHGVADADGGFVERLGATRGVVVVGIMRVVTTVGDVVPSLLLAGGLAVVAFRRAGAGLWPLLLPLVVLVELLFQFGFAHVFSDFVLADVRPSLPIDGSGPLPSGSVARLLSLSAVAALLWRRSGSTHADRFLTVGGVAVLVEVVSRAYLGRHLVGDLVGGLLLGVLLSLAAALLIGTWGRQAEPEPGALQK